ncbi:S8 family serine peptidase [Actinomadura viridis]|uniref:S8 family serine peptidase n=1 Tax=Actinomadura viridis TaxID=58110 RepID=UPI00369CFB9A
MRAAGAASTGALLLTTSFSFFLAPQASAAPLPAAAPRAACDVARGHPGPIGDSWAQRRLGFERVWALTQGRGVRTAVIDSGADTKHPMLAGRIADVIDLTGTGERDCAGHGTGVAALLGGRDVPGVPLRGVAPAAEILVVKQQNAERDDGGGARLPKAIRRAVDAGARVVNISIKAAASPDLEQAVQYAHRRNAVIVAAAGNARDQEGDEGAAYPASYPGVISVASLGPDGARAESSSVRSKVDIAAPGVAVPTAWPGGGYNPRAEGTSHAAAYVSGVATLVRARHPHLDRSQVVHRLLATADGNTGPGTGHGMVNPVQAVTAVVPGETAAAAGRPPAPASLAAPEPADGRTRSIAVTVTAGTLSAAALAGLLGLIAPMGRRRGWRPGRSGPAAPPPTGDPETATAPSRGTIGARP